MLTETDLTEYRDEIRRQVCSCCIERPPGGPPCGPLGKPCGVELHLESLIETIHDVQSPLIEPYLEHNRHDICQGCAYLHNSHCPCPMDYLAVPLVQAVEEVDRRRALREKGHRFISSLPAAESTGLADVYRAYEKATGTWTGCDWPTRFGKTGLDLNGWTADEAESMAVESIGRDDAEDWGVAATWLRRIERSATDAETEASLAVAAAHAGKWDEAVRCARRARGVEFMSGRTLRRGPPLTWGPLCQMIEAALRSPESVV
jgi:hypothetical protein